MHQNVCDIVVAYKLRLGEGKSTCVGIVEVFYLESWVTVCGNNFDFADVEVVCRTLGASFEQS